MNETLQHHSWHRLVCRTPPAHGGEQPTTHPVAPAWSGESGWACVGRLVACRLVRDPADEPCAATLRTLRIVRRLLAPHEFSANLAEKSVAELVRALIGWSRISSPPSADPGSLPRSITPPRTGRHTAAKSGPSCSADRSCSRIATLARGFWESAPSWPKPRASAERLDGVHGGEGGPNRAASVSVSEWSPRLRGQPRSLTVAAPSPRAEVYATHSFGALESSVWISRPRRRETPLMYALPASSTLILVLAVPHAAEARRLARLFRAPVEWAAKMDRHAQPRQQCPLAGPWRGPRDGDDESIVPPAEGLALTVLLSGQPDGRR